jgi:DNA-binding Lrp family transcriptional regulator
MDPLDRQLLNLLQESVPLVPSPFAALGRELGLEEDEVLSRTQRLKEAGIIRQIGPIFSSRRLGYQSTLVAFHVEPERLEEVAALISAHPGVSHNYSRNHFYNLWFTLTLPPHQDVEDEIARLAEESSIDDYLNLPSLRLFKLGVHFDMSDKKTRPKEETSAPEAEPSAPLTDFERDVVRALQGHMPLVSHPFDDAAIELGVTTEELLRVIRDLDQRGVLRRFSAVLKHRNAGFTANGMACWVVPEGRIAEAGASAAAFPSVSHCYQRPAYAPRWPYNLFTMVHGRTRDDVEEVVERIHQEIGPVEHTILYSQREFKKERVQYFVHSPSR